MSNWYELALILIILIGIGISIWKGGAANPVGTGGLLRQLSSIDGDVKNLNTKVGEIERQVEDIDDRSAKVDDIKRLERRLKLHDQKMDKATTEISAMRADFARQGAQTEQTAKQVDLLYTHIVSKGMNS